MQNNQQQPVYANLIGEQIKPLLKLSYKEIKRVWEDLTRAKSNNQAVNRDTIIQQVERSIEDNLVVYDKWNETWVVQDENGQDIAMPHWNTWDDDELFRTLLQIFTEDGQSNDVIANDLNGLVASKVRALHLKDIEKFSQITVNAYLSKFDEYTTKYGDMATLTRQQNRAIIKIAIDNLIKNRSQGTSAKTAGYLKVLLDQQYPKIKTFTDFRRAFLTTWNKVKTSCETAALCGYVEASSHEKSDSKRKYPTGTTSSASDHGNKKAKSADTSDKCTACGRSGHTYNDCKLVHFHPNVNKNRNISFDESDEGKRCQTVFGKSELPFKKNLDQQDIVVPEKYLPKPKNGSSGECINCVYLHSLQQQSYTHPIISCEILLPRAKAQQQQQEISLTCNAVLIDTGALDANYVDENFAHVLSCKGIEIDNTNTSKVCSALDISHCKITKGNVKLNLRIHNEQTNKYEIITAHFKVVKLTNFDIVIGIYTIRQFDLINKYISYFSATQKTFDEVDNVSEECKRETSYLATYLNPNSTPTYESIELCSGLTTGQNKIHIRELLGESDASDDLQIQQQNTNVVTTPSQWEIYSNTYLSENKSSAENDECLPTEVHFAYERHRKLFLKYRNVFSRSVRSEPAQVPPMTLTVDETKWQVKRHRLPPRFQSTLKHEEIRKQITNMIELNVIEPSQATEWSQVTLATKPNGKWRFCIDYKELNQVTKGLGFPLPNIQAILLRIGNKKPKIFALLDMTSGYHQMPLDASSRYLTAFITTLGLNQWLRVPFGLKGAPAYFMFIMATVVLLGILYLACEVYLDDILIYGQSEDEYFTHLEQVLERLEKHKLTVNPDKAVFGVDAIEYVGYYITHEGISHSRTRIDKVLDIEKPTNTKQLKSFIGVVEYFHEHVRDFSTVLLPLRKLLVNYDKRKAENHPLGYGYLICI